MPDALPQAFTAEDLRARAGQALGVSHWVTVDQPRIDAFATVSNDHQFIHVNPELAAKTPFGGTIAHGFLTLSLLSGMAKDVLPRIANMAMSVNYGFDRVRFLAPVPSGSRIRGAFKLDTVTARGDTELRVRYVVSVEIENSPKTALMAEWVVLYMLAPAKKD